MVDFNHPTNGEEPGGKGDGSYISPVQANKLVGMMLNPRRRWKITKEAKQHAMSATIRNLDDEDGRVVNGAVANLIRMEGQNQTDANLDKQRDAKSTHIENQQVNIYLPSNGREQTNGLLNGHSSNGTNGKH